MERAVAVVGRGTHAEQVGRSELHLFAEQLCEAGLAHPWIATQQDEVAMPGTAVLPSLLEDGPLRFPANEGGQHAGHLDAFSGRVLAGDEPKPHRFGDTLEPPLSEALALDIAL